MGLGNAKRFNSTTITSDDFNQRTPACFASLLAVFQMPVSPLLPLAAPAAVQLVERLREQVAGGLTFAQTLAARISDRRIGHDTDEVVSPGEPGGPVATPASLAHAQELSAQQLDRFLEQFESFAAKRDIDVTRGIELKLDGRGRVVLANDHPDRAAIEQHFESDGELAAAFRRVAAAFTSSFQLASLSEETPRGALVMRLDQSGVSIRFE